MVHVLESLLFSRHYNIATFVQTCAGCDCWYTEIECRWTLSPFTPGPQVEVLSTNDRTVSTRQQLPCDMPALPIHLWYPPSTAGGGDTEERKKLHSYTPYIVSWKSYHWWSSTHLQYLAYDVWYRIKVHPNTPTLMGWCKWKGVVYTYYNSTGRDLPKKLRLLGCATYMYYVNSPAPLRFVCTAHAPIYWNFLNVK